MIPQHEADRIRREAEKKYKKPKDFQRKTYIEASVIEWERKAYEAGATAEYLRHKPVVEALGKLNKELDKIWNSGVLKMPDTYVKRLTAAQKECYKALQQLNQ